MKKACEERNYNGGRICITYLPPGKWGCSRRAMKYHLSSKTFYVAPTTLIIILPHAKALGYYIVRSCKLLVFSGEEASERFLKSSAYFPCIYVLYKFLKTASTV